MKKYVEILGNAIEKDSLTHPERARKLLTTAYSWVRFSGQHSLNSGLHGAYDAMNSAVIGTIIDSFRHPEKSVMVNIFMPCEFLHVMGIQPMFPEGISVYLTCTGCQKVFAEVAEANDVPESFCSYHKTMLGTAETGLMPKPLMIANTTLACDANQLSFRHLADFYQVPHTIIDIPHSMGPDAVEYVANQLRTFASQLEDLTHQKLDEVALREVMERSRRTAIAFQSYLNQRSNITLPTTMTGELLSIIANHVMLGRADSENYMNRILDCAKSASPRTEHKKRIFWIHTLPNWQDSMKAIFEIGDRCEIVGTDISLDALTPIDPNQPYESMARRTLESVCNGSAQRRVEIALRYAKALKADGVIVFCHWGCKQTLGMSQMAKQAMEAEGLPTLVLDGDGCDVRNVADGQMITRVNAFLEQLEGRVNA